jgi:hypothetical protein
MSDLASRETVAWHQTTFCCARKFVTPEAAALRLNIAVSVSFVARGEVKEWGYTSRTVVYDKNR